MAVEHIRRQENEQRAQGNSVLETIKIMESVGKEHNVIPVVVGGIIPRLLGPDTTVNFDFGTKTMHITNAVAPALMRESGTKVDIDFVCIAGNDQEIGDFNSSYHTFQLRIEDFKNDLSQGKNNYAKEHQSPVPKTSPEAFYYTGDVLDATSAMDIVGKNVVTQSGDKSDPRGIPHFALDTIQQPVTWESLAPWRVTFDGNLQGYTLTTFNPQTLLRRYYLRGFGDLKAKDVAKVTDPAPLYRLSEQFKAEYIARFGQEAYDNMYSGWDAYREQLRKSDDPRIAVKRRIYNDYWHTLGEIVSQSPLGNLDSVLTKFHRR